MQRVVPKPGLYFVYCQTSSFQLISTDGTRSHFTETVSNHAPFGSICVIPNNDNSSVSLFSALADHAVMILDESDGRQKLFFGSGHNHPNYRRDYEQKRAKLQLFSIHSNADFGSFSQNNRVIICLANSFMFVRMSTPERVLFADVGLLSDAKLSEFIFVPMQEHLKTLQYVLPPKVYHIRCANGQYLHITGENDNVQVVSSDFTKSSFRIDYDDLNSSTGCGTITIFSMSRGAYLKYENNFFGKRLVLDALDRRQSLSSSNRSAEEDEANASDASDNSFELFPVNLLLDKSACVRIRSANEWKFLEISKLSKEGIFSSNTTSLESEFYFESAEN